MQVKKLNDIIPFADKLRNYSKKNGADCRQISAEKFVLRRGEKLYCPRCNTKNKLGSVYCKECGFILEAVDKKADTFKAKDLTSNLRIKDALKVNFAAILIMLIACIIIKPLILDNILGQYSSYLNVLGAILIINGGRLSISTYMPFMSSMSNYQSLGVQVGLFILALIPVIAIAISYKLFMKNKSLNKSSCISNSLSIGIIYGLILALATFLVAGSASLENQFFNFGNSTSYGFNTLGLFIRGFVIGFLTVLYMSIRKEYENAYLNIFKFAFRTIALGYVILFVLLALCSLLKINYINVFGLGKSITGLNIVILISQFAAYILGFMNLIPVAIGNKNLLFANVFATSIGTDFKLCLIAFIALSALILIVAGVKLNRKYKNLGVKSVVIFSIMYAMFMALIALFTAVDIAGGSQMAMNVVLAFVISLLYSFVITFVGFKLNSLD